MQILGLILQMVITGSNAYRKSSPIAFLQTKTILKIYISSSDIKIWQLLMQWHK